MCDDSVRMILVGYRAGDVGGAALAYARRRALVVRDEVDAEMLVVGVAVDTTGRLLHRAIGRSTGRDLLRHARRPVLFVPGEPSR